MILKNNKKNLLENNMKNKKIYFRYFRSKIKNWKNILKLIK